MSAFVSSLFADKGTRLGAHQWGVRALVLLGTGFTLLVSAQAGTKPGNLTTAVAFFLSVVTLKLPDSHAGLVLVGVLAWGWFHATDDPRTPLVVAAAVGLLVVHAGAALAASAPPQARFDRRTVLHWLAQGAAMAGLTALVWSATAVIGRVNTAGSVFSTFVALLAVTGLALLLRRESLPRPP